MPVELKTCPTCGGDGELATSHRFTCYSCGGSGTVEAERYEKLLEEERQAQRHFDNALRASEYRQMGG
jgi:DnaJ-class molecular chaperone